MPLLAYRITYTISGSCATCLILMFSYFIYKSLLGLLAAVSRRRLPDSDVAALTRARVLGIVLGSLCFVFGLTAAVCGHHFDRELYMSVFLSFEAVILLVSGITLVVHATRIVRQIAATQSQFASSQQQRGSPRNSPLGSPMGSPSFGGGSTSVGPRSVPMLRALRAARNQENNGGALLGIDSPSHVWSLSPAQSPTHSPSLSPPNQMLHIVLPKSAASASSASSSSSSSTAVHTTTSVRPASGLAQSRSAINHHADQENCSHGATVEKNAMVGGRDTAEVPIMEPFVVTQPLISAHPVVMLVVQSTSVNNHHLHNLADKSSPESSGLSSSAPVGLDLLKGFKIKIAVVTLVSLGAAFALLFSSSRAFMNVEERFSPYQTTEPRSVLLWIAS